MKVPILDEVEFKEAWEHLERAERRRITRTVRRGEALPEPEWASLAVSYSRKALRGRRLQALLFSGMFVFWLGVLAWFLRNVEFSPSTWGFWIAPVGWVLAIPLQLALLFMFWLPRFRRAETLNLAVVERSNRERGAS